MIKSILALVLSASICVASRADAADLYEPGFEGTWTGALRMLDPNTHNPMPLNFDMNAPIRVEMSIEFKGGEARVLLKESDGWVEVKPGKFVTLFHKTNGVVAAIESNIAPDQSAGWVETWNFTLTHKDDGSLYAFWVRSVNNYAMPAGSNVSARFFMSAFGELSRSGRTLVGQTQPGASTPSLNCAMTKSICEQGAQVMRPH